MACINNNFLDFLAAFAPYVAIFGGYLLAKWQLTKTMDVAKDEREIKELAKKLNEFYAPFNQLRKKSNALYQEFNLPFREVNPSFSTLKYLLDGHKFEGNSETLLNEIIMIGEECERFIHDNAGLIDDPVMRSDILPKLTTHYRLLKLANEGKLSSSASGGVNLGAYSFPREIDNLIEQRINEIEARLRELNRKTTD